MLGAGIIGYAMSFDHIVGWFLFLFFRNHNANVRSLVINDLEQVTTRLIPRSGPSTTASRRLVAIIKDPLRFELNKYFFLSSPRVIEIVYDAFVSGMLTFLHSVQLYNFTHVHSMLSASVLPADRSSRENQQGSGFSHWPNEVGKRTQWRQTIRLRYCRPLC
jgi:hypothetical protein